MRIVYDGRFHTMKINTFGIGSANGSVREYKYFVFNSDRYLSKCVVIDGERIDYEGDPEIMLPPIEAHPLRRTVRVADDRGIVLVSPSQLSMRTLRSVG